MAKTPRWNLRLFINIRTETYTFVEFFVSCHIFLVLFTTLHQCLTTSSKLSSLTICMHDFHILPRSHDCCTSSVVRSTQTISLTEVRKCVVKTPIMKAIRILAIFVVRDVPMLPVIVGVMMPVVNVLVLAECVPPG